MKTTWKLLVVVVGLLLASNGWSQAYSWTTIAGLSGTNNSGSADGTNSVSRFNKPYGIAVDAAGNLYVADSGNHIIRTIKPTGTNWVTTTLVGLSGSSGSPDGTNSVARFNSPRGIGVDGSGNLYVADMFNNTIRKVTPVGFDWVVTTIAGKAMTGGYANGTNGDARFNAPRSIALDNATNLFVADYSNFVVRKAKPVGTNWVVSLVAGTGYGYVDGTNNAAKFSDLSGVAVDSTRNIFVADTQNNVIRGITPAGTDWVVSTLAGLKGNLGNADGTNSDARFWSPRGVAIDGARNVYVADANCKIRKMTPIGTNWVVTTLGGIGGVLGTNDGIGTNALFNQPFGIAVDSAGNLFVADTFNHAIRMGRYIPLLQCIPSGNQFNLSWPSVSPVGFVLQQNADLTTTNWTDVGLPVTDDGTNKSVTLSPSATNLFFRLRSP